MGISSHYNEQIYFTWEDSGELLAQNQDAIVDVLTKNKAVGVVGGFFEQDFPIYFVSRFMLENLGYTYDQFMETTKGNYAGLVYEKDWTRNFQKKQTREYVKQEYRLMNQKGEVVWVSELRRESVSPDGKVLWIAAIRMIDEVYQRESALLSALGQEYLSIIYINLNNKTYEWVKRERIILNGQLSGDMEELFEFFNYYIQEYVHPGDIEVQGVLELLQACIDGTGLKRERTQITYRRLSGEQYKWAQIHLIFGESLNGGNGYLVIAFRDVDDRIRLELDSNRLLVSALEKQKTANMAKRDFLSKMSHDMRTPLHGLANVIALAKKSHSLSQIQQKYIPLMQATGNHLLQLINEVLDINDIENGGFVVKSELFSLEQFIRKTAAILTPEIEAKKQSLVIDLGNMEHDIVLGDEDVLQKIFFNLLSNATKYSGENAMLTVLLEELPPKRDGYGCYRFQVCDTGIGIAPDMFEKIFEQFTRIEDTRISQIPYIGLGLTITKSLVEMLDGTIEVSSELGKGSCFTVSLELKLPERKNKLPEQTVDLSDMTILLVEDNELNRELTCDILQMEGIHVEEAENGAEAVEMFEKHPKGYYDVILMDIQMPVMNGYLAARKIRTMINNGGDKIPIVAVTADAFQEDIQMALQSGMNDHIKKPEHSSH